MSEQQFHADVMAQLEQSMSNNLAKMREPFPAHQISRLPKPTKQQTEEVKADFQKGIRCGDCGAWHHPKVVHLDYVGHAALTDRLLDTDPAWDWKPLAIDATGYPVIDSDGGMWIALTVCGVTRLGYGDAQGKTGGNATKERIGDALRNAAMRFGAALDLWHKGELHVDEAAPVKVQRPDKPPKILKPEFKTENWNLIPDRADELFVAAKAAVAHHMAGDDQMAYEEISGITDNDEKQYLWGVLREFSALRAAIKVRATQ